MWRCVGRKGRHSTAHWPSHASESTCSWSPTSDYRRSVRSAGGERGFTRPKVQCSALSASECSRLCSITANVKTNAVKMPMKRKLQDSTQSKPGLYLSNFSWGGLRVSDGNTTPKLKAHWAHTEASAHGSLLPTPYGKVPPPNLKCRR